MNITIEDRGRINRLVKWLCGDKSKQGFKIGHEMAGLDSKFNFAFNVEWSKEEGYAPDFYKDGKYNKCFLYSTDYMNWVKALANSDKTDAEFIESYKRACELEQEKINLRFRKIEQLN